MRQRWEIWKVYDSYWLEVPCGRAELDNCRRVAVFTATYEQAMGVLGFFK